MSGRLKLTVHDEIGSTRPAEYREIDDAYSYGYGDPNNSSFLFHELKLFLRLVRLRWRAFLAVALAVLLLGALFNLRIPDRFSSETKILVVPEQVNVIDLEAVASGVAGDLTGLLSEIEFIRSLEVLDRVLLDLGVEGQLKMLTLAAEKGSVRTRVEETFVGLFRDTPDPILADAELADLASPPTTAPAVMKGWLDDITPNQEILAELGPEGVYARSAKLLSDSLSVGQIGNSRAILVTMTGLDPRFAADIVNRVAEAYIAAQVEIKFDAARLANNLLNEQLSGLRTQIDTQEAEIEGYRESVGLDNADEVELAADRVQQLSVAMTTTRARLAAIMARKSEAENIRQNRQLLESTADVLDSELIELLRFREIELEQELLNLSERLQPGHPEMVRLQSELSQLRVRIDAEVDKIIQSISSEEQTVRAELGVLERTLSESNSQLVELNKAEREIDALNMELQANRSLLETFIARSRETEVQEDFQTPDAQIIARGQIVYAPSGPQRMILNLLFIVSSVVAASTFVVLREVTDPRIRSLSSIYEATKAPLLGALPDLKNRKNAFALSDIAEIVRDDPHSEISDLMRRLYFSLTNSIGIGARIHEISEAGSPHENEQNRSGSVILVTSTRPNEGKTSFSCSLAMTAARFGKTVLIIDFDLRKPSIENVFAPTDLGAHLDGTKAPGIVELLNRQVGFEQVRRFHEETGVQFISRGAAVRHPAEFVERQLSAAFLSAVRKHFDLVIIDSAPVLAAPETSHVGRLVDQTIFIVNWSITKKREFSNAFREIDKARRPGSKVQVLINKIPTWEIAALELSQGDYSSYAQYREYGNGYYEKAAL